MAAKKSRKKVINVWTKEEIRTLKKEYPRTNTQELANKLNRTIEALRFQAKKYEVKKTKKFMASLYSSARKPAAKKPSKKKSGKKK